VHDPSGCPDDVAAECFTDALVAHADAEEREARAELGDCLKGDSGLFGRAWTGADQDPCWVHRGDLCYGDGVVGDDDVVAPEVAEVLDGERKKV
jgi:hypothetical protein